MLFCLCLLRTALTLFIGQDILPSGICSCRGPADSLDLGEAVKIAESTFFKLFPDKSELFVKETNEDEDEDDIDDEV